MKKTLALTIGGAIATALTASPMVNAQENPFGLQKISGTQVLAEADAKMPEGGCSGSKMKEGGCNGTAKPEEKMKEGGCSGKM